MNDDRTVARRHDRVSRRLNGNDLKISGGRSRSRKRNDNDETGNAKAFPESVFRAAGFSPRGFPLFDVLQRVVDPV